MTTLRRTWPLGVALTIALVLLAITTSLRAVAACTLTAALMWAAA